jgi:ligand-binding sensor domain-containing protein
LILLLASCALLLPSCKNKDNVLAPPPPGPVWLTFTHATVPALLDNGINGFGLGVDGSVWIATDSGASNFLAGNWGYIRDTLRYTIFNSSGATSSYKVNSVVAGRDGSVWFGLAGGGVRRYHRGSPFFVWQKYEEPDVAFGTISSMASDLYKYGDIWVATPVNGISRYTMSLTQEDEGTWRQYTTASDPTLLTDRIRSVAYNDYDNTVWFGSYLGANMFSEITGWSKYQLPVDQEGTIVSIWFDKTDYVWFAKDEGLVPGVTRYNRASTEYTSFTNATTGGKLSQFGVTAVVGNNVDTHWFGTLEGLTQLKDTTWTTFSTANTPEMPGDIVTALIVDKKNNLWIGTTQGIAVYNPSGTRF